MRGERMSDHAGRIARSFEMLDGKPGDKSSRVVTAKGLQSACHEQCWNVTSSDQERTVFQITAKNVYALCCKKNPHLCLSLCGVLIEMRQEQFPRPLKNPPRP